MTDTTTNPAVTRYLRDLERALRDVPAARRREIVEEIRGHIEESTSVPGEGGDVELRTVLDQVGDPETIAEEARERLGISKSKAGALERIAIALLLVGGLILPAVGWVMGAVVLGISRTWTLALMIVVTLLPVLTAVYLGRRAFRR
jgi:uncharacterized membrane protein